jgi:hypothetical protein
MVLMHMTGGRGARIQEHLTLACSNTASRQRSIGIYNGKLFSVTQHHKASRRTNNEFQVARFYPTPVASLLYDYLVFIRPFASMLARRCLAVATAPTTQSRLLFAPMSTAGVWTTQTFSDTLGQISASVLPSLPVRLNARLYRQLCIAISEKHVRGVARPFDRHNDRTRSAPCDIAFAWQSGHRPIQLSTTYGLDGAFPTHLQPRLLQIYAAVSTEWHAFLDMHHSKLPLKRGLTDEPRGLTSEPPLQKRVRLLATGPHATNGMPSPFAYNVEHQVIICQRCCTCLLPTATAWASHLRQEPHRMSGTLLNATIDSFRGLPLRTKAELKRHKPIQSEGGPSQAIEGLACYTGYRCAYPKCNYCTRVKRTMMYEHQPVAHQRHTQSRAHNLLRVMIG